MADTSAEEDYLRRLIRREHAGDHSDIQLGLHSVVVLSWVIRWAAGRPQLVEWAPELFGSIDAQFAELLADDPDGVALRQRGEPVALRSGPTPR